MVIADLNRSIRLDQVLKPVASLYAFRFFIRYKTLVMLNNSIMPLSWCNTASQINSGVPANNKQEIPSAT